MRSRTICAVVSTFLLATAMASAQTVDVNFGSSEQTIRGFGGSTAWLGQLTVPQADALFNPTSGLGLSMLRVRIDPTGTAPGWVPTNGGWLTEVENAQEAVAANPNAIVFATPWTPPASLKTSSTAQPYYSGTCSPAAGYCGGYLNPSNYAAYAAYLQDFVTYFNTNAGFDLYAISMQNEPDYANVDYESCSWTAAQMDAWIDSLTAGGATNPLTAKLIMPESFQFIQAQSNTALEDASAEPLISIIGGHIYGVSPAPYPLAVQDDKPLWMTEHALTPSGSEPAITDALALAEEVNSSMVTGNYSAYVYWWIWDNPADDINYGLINASTTDPVPTYYGYAIGQFSKYIQPGYVMVSATNPIAGVYDSAYMGDGNLVIVAINSNTTATSFPVAVSGQIATSFTPYQTSATNTMTQLTAVSVSNGGFTYSLPAQSITTFVGSASTTPGFTLSTSAASVSLPQGKSVTDTVTVANLNGFTGNVALAATGMPAGVTAAFGTNPTTGTSVLTLTASSTATTGSATITVTGTSGSISETATISLFVGSSSCAVAYTISPQSTTAFGGAIDIYNTSSTALTSWSLAWAFPNGQTISSIWNDGTETQTGANVTVTNASFNGTIAAGGSLNQLGFNGTWNGVTNSPPAAFTLNGVTCTNGAPSAATPSFTLAPSASPLSVTQGSSATDTITVTGTGGFTGSVSFAATGLPSGVTASFSPASSTSSSVLTLAASSTATVGTATVTITGTSGTLTETTTFTLTVAGVSPGSFTLKPSASTLSVTQGSTTTDTITVTDVSPFNSGVTLSATGLPAGVTVAYGTNPATSTSVLTFTASSTATAGVSTVTITGTSGSLTATTTIALTAVASSPGSFTLKPSAGTLSVVQGASGTDTITVTDVSPFNSSVTLSATGLPTGVTAAFATNPTTSTSVLTLTASSTAAAGISTVTITGTSGTLTPVTTTIALTVAPSGGACTVDYTIAPQNTSAFGASITIVNGPTAITSWTLTWTFANGQTVSSLWNGIETQSGANVTVKNEPYNGSIAAGGTLSGIGFNGTWNRTTNTVPTAFSLNGTACTVN
ncbi:MAG: cellulose binding domain-containing protein [Terracidiphilus sp.]